MDGVARLPERERLEILQETAAHLGLGSQIVEKDFWVCWVLHRLFDAKRDWPGMLFKGGTSLSKGFHAITRFSEDIDLSLNRHNLGFVGNKDPLRAIGSKKALGKLKERLDGACMNFVRDKALPELMADFTSVIGSPVRWSMRIDQAGSQTNLLFSYPTQLPADDYLKPIIALEFGARSDHDRTQEVPVTSFAAEEFPEQFVVPSVVVKTYDPTRTFWEKATILHYHHHVNDPTKVGRQSRHYYDTVMLARGPIGQSALRDIELLQTVAAHKSVFFTKTSAKYEEARSGSLRLVPQKIFVAALRSDYEKMQPMLYGDKPTFDDMIRELDDIEKRFNSPA